MTTYKIPVLGNFSIIQRKDKFVLFHEGSAIFSDTSLKSVTDKFNEYGVQCLNDEIASLVHKINEITTIKTRGLLTYETTDDR